MVDGSEDRSFHPTGIFMAPQTPRSFVSVSSPELSIECVLLSALSSAPAVGGTACTMNVRRERKVAVPPVRTPVALPKRTQLQQPGTHFPLLHEPAQGLTRHRQRLPAVGRSHHRIVVEEHLHGERAGYYSQPPVARSEKVFSKTIATLARRSGAVWEGNHQHPSFRV